MTPHDPTSPGQPLDAEERALAERLARIGPHGEPSPALDSRILSAAHAAVDHASASASRPRGRHDRTSTPGAHKPGTLRRPPRWPLGLGIAASVALAIGLAWQMRPLPDATPAYRSEADSALAGAAVENKQAAEPVARVADVTQAETAKPASAADAAQPHRRRVDASGHVGAG